MLVLLILSILLRIIYISSTLDGLFFFVFSYSSSAVQITVFLLSPCVFNALYQVNIFEKKGKYHLLGASNVAPLP